LRMRSTLLTGNSFSCPAACRKSLEPVAAAAAFGAQPSHRVVLPLVELAARAVLAQPQLNWCKGQLPEGLHRYLEGAGGGCTVCRNTRFVREFNTALINDPSFLGFPNVARRIKICSQQCDSRWRLSDHAKHLSQW
jgi:hypothetical protein